MQTDVCTSNGEKTYLQKGFPALTPIFHAKYYDYDDDWYAQVGYLLVQTMGINCFVPIAAQCATVTVAYLKRWLD